MDFSVDAVKSAVKAEDAQALLGQLSLAHGSRDCEQNLIDYFEIMPKDEATKCWNVIKTSVDSSVSKLVSARMPEEAVEAEVKQLQLAVSAVSAFTKKNHLRLNSMLQIIDALLSLLELLDSTSVTVLSFKNAVSMLCEQWYLKGELGASQLLPQLMTYLLVESLKPTSKEGAIKRLYNMRQGFNELDIANAGKDFKKELLLRCYVHPTFLKSADGQKLLSILLTASEGLLLEPVVNLVKAQICNGVKSLAIIYGEMLQRAWRDSPMSNTVDTNTKVTKNKAPVLDKLRLSIEDSMQELIDEATHCSDPKYFRGLRCLIKAFHDVKRTEQLDEMLVKVFEPILWRSLRCANAIVRSQASVLFLDVFPLQKTNAKPEECDQLLQKQFDQLTSLLKDGDHRVRATATSGVCHILREYWDILPAGTVQNLLKFIFETLAFDVSSANVRHSVICGVQEILQQPLAHQALKALLPLIANLIHDKAEKNRLAFVRLLNDVKNIKGIHFYEVVSVEHLMERFAQDRDHADICNAMCELLLGSFFPQRSKAEGGNDGKDLVNRCIKFIDENALAAEAFYRSLHQHISIGAVTKLVVMLFHVLHVNAGKVHFEATDETQKGKRKRGETKEADEGGQLKKSTLFGLNRVILALLQSIEHQLVNELPCIELFFKFFAPEKVIPWIETVVLNFHNDPAFVATSLQILSVVVKLSNEVNIEGVDLQAIQDKFSAAYILGEVLPASLLAVTTDASKKWLCKAVLEIIFAGNQELECAKYLKKSIEAYAKGFKSSKTKASKESVIGIDVTAFALATFTEFICDPHYSSQAGNKLSEELERVWQSTMAMVSIVLASESIDQIAAKEIEAISILMKAVLTFAVYEDISQALVNEGQAASLAAMSKAVHWVQEAILPTCVNPQSLVQVEISQNIFSASMLALTDALHLLNDTDHHAVATLLVTLLDTLDLSVSANNEVDEFILCWHNTAAFGKFAAVVERLTTVLPHLLESVDANKLSELLICIVSIAKQTLDALPVSESGPDKSQQALQRSLAAIVNKCFAQSDLLDNSDAMLKLATLSRQHSSEPAKKGRGKASKSQKDPTTTKPSLTAQLLSKEIQANQKLSAKFSSLLSNEPSGEEDHENVANIARRNNTQSVLLGVH